MTTLWPFPSVGAGPDTVDLRMRFPTRPQPRRSQKSDPLSKNHVQDMFLLIPQDIVETIFAGYKSIFISIYQDGSSSASRWIYENIPLKWWFPQTGVPPKWMIYKGKSQSKMDDERGYPHDYGHLQYIRRSCPLVYGSFNKSAMCKCMQMSRVMEGAPQFSCKKTSSVLYTCP